MEKKILIECRDVSLGYEDRTVWEHLDFTVSSGDYLCIVGENGSGKSTLLKSLLGLLKPLRGTITTDPSLRRGFEQLDLFTDYEAEEKRREEENAQLQREKRRQQAVLDIRKKYGKNAILKGMNFEEGATTKDRNKQIGGHKA